MVTPLIGAAAFLVFYLGVGPVMSRLQSGPMPLPGAPKDQVYAYLTSNPAASIATGILQGLSIIGLMILLASPVLRVTWNGDQASSARRSLLLAIGAVAAAGMLVAVGLSIAAGVTA